MMTSGVATICSLAPTFGEMYGTQLLEPRSTSTSADQREVTAADSM